MPIITPDWLFGRSGIEFYGTVQWGQPLPEPGAGVYVVTATKSLIGGQHVIYIGRSRSLSRRLRQFYRHKYGASAPHRGGQEILKLDGPKIVHWARVEAYAEAERLMLEAFQAEVGAWPYGNRVKSARMTSISN